MNRRKVFTHSEDARHTGQFSRRHATSQPQTAARIAWEERQMLKKHRAYYRSENAKGRSTREQLALLDARLGIDKGAAKERATLLKRIIDEEFGVINRELHSIETDLAAISVEIDDHRRREEELDRVLDLYYDDPAVDDEPSPMGDF